MSGYDILVQLGVEIMTVYRMKLFYVSFNARVRYFNVSICFCKTGKSYIILNCIIQELSGYDNIKMVWIGYLAVLGSEGYSIYDMAYYPCPVYDNIMSVYVSSIIFLIFTCH